MHTWLLRKPIRQLYLSSLNWSTYELAASYITVFCKLYIHTHCILPDTLPFKLKDHRLLDQVMHCTHYLPTHLNHHKESHYESCSQMVEHQRQPLVEVLILQCCPYSPFPPCQLPLRLSQVNQNRLRQQLQVVILIAQQLWTS